MASGDPSALLFFVGTYVAVVSVPGPNFLVLSRASLSSRPVGTAAALGIATGAALAAAAIVLALALLQHTRMPQQLTSLNLVLGLVYGTLLVRAGVAAVVDLVRAGPGAWRAPAGLARDAAGAFRLGLVTAATNPATLAFFVSSCGLLLSGMGRKVALAGPLLVFAVALTWFGVLGLLLSAGPTRRIYGKVHVATDAGMGTMLMAAGVWVIVRTLLAPLS